MRYGCVLNLVNIYHSYMLIVSYFSRVVVFVLGILYMSLLYGLYIPDWGFEVMSENRSLSAPEYGTETQIVSIKFLMYIFLCHPHCRRMMARL